MDNKVYLLALHSIDGLGPIRLKAILDYFKDPKLAWEADGLEFSKIGIPKNVVELLVQRRKKLEPLTFAQLIKDARIDWLTILDGGYPKLLSQIYDPPSVLYYKGDVNILNTKSVAIVGTRKITNYGKAITEQFTKTLASAGLTIVSGLARGVDSYAHWAAINAGGQTVAVLGGGLNNIFPPENIGLAQKIADGSGIVISEFPPDSPSLAGNFPARNRIISGLSLATLVIEAAEDSGSLITARLALEQGREVFAVPGPVTSALSKGPIDLIKEGATPVFDPKEILEQLGIKGRKQATGDRLAHETNLTEEEKAILKALENETLHIDEIGRKIDFPSGKLAAFLLKMEIAGLVQNLGCGNYCSNMR
ncbi:DNA protecting protein DprA [Candidatus Daviesbacteria bacterium RIFCSPHIGHO2_02_FULL_39_12]|uniref:DNA protecting protein DprA n=2 Tax=Candidatus Daviesiibacteriota TaxID=1752718 RepID=A0A1F5J8U4_9BACT|nr:MAG: DNA protecting protein DprA [Candidatus Daviesbacteria bacterium RIFCSPHIGHO2_02_FULL_39_12]OGE72281.1 MAG: DNA protecting protein DprA [Candidatus Daviesbacteria bacterium RIFCSPLOWO2_02_FULL_38_15]